MDTVSAQARSQMMAAVRNKHTKPEQIVRKLLFANGFRYRLNDKSIPGSPDLVLKKHNALIFVHGCFWHQHGCKRSSLPSTRRSWWSKKLQGNKVRDEQTLARLFELGWRVLVIWECSIRVPKRGEEKAIRKTAVSATKFLKSSRRFAQIPRSPKRVA